MKAEEVLKAIVAILIVVSSIGCIYFYIDITKYMKNMIQGDVEASQKFSELIKNEVISEVQWTIAKEFLTMMLSCLGVICGITLPLALLKEL